MRRLLMLSLLLGGYFAGGVIGALGFQRIGDAMTLPLAALLVLLAIVPAADDVKDYFARPKV